MNNLEDVKKHIANHKRVYIIAGAVVASGAALAGAYILGTRSVPRIADAVVTPRQTNFGLTWKPLQTVEVTVEALGDPGNIIQDLTTGTIYASQNQAAKALEVSKSVMSNHLNGGSNYIAGTHKLVKLGKAHVPAVGTSALV